MIADVRDCYDIDYSDAAVYTHLTRMMTVAREKRRAFWVLLALNTL